MDLRQLRYFRAVADCGGFSAAAAVLRIAQSALSRQVALLEAECGGALFERGVHGVALTPSGRVLLQRASFLLQQVEEARSEVQAENANPRGTVRLVFANSGDAGAVFHVYDKRHLDRLPRRYLVEPGRQLEDDWAAMADDGGAYDLWVLGPNGYHRHFKGDLNRLRPRDAAEPEVRVGYHPRRGELHLLLRNDGRRDCSFTVKPLAYRGDPARTLRVRGGDDMHLHWDLDESGFWYDFAVTVDTDPAFYRRIAGRLETGRHSVSDPAMGT